MNRLPSDETFKISSFCTCGCEKCVAVAVTSDGVYVRDTKDADKATLAFTPDEWSVFVKGVKAGDFDL